MRPVDFEIRMRRRSSPFCVVTKTASPQMAGVLVPHSGSGHFQAIPDVSLQATGSPVSALDPVPSGPRHWGQSPAPTSPARASTPQRDASAGRSPPQQIPINRNLPSSPRPRAPAGTPGRNVAPKYPRPGCESPDRPWGPESVSKNQPPSALRRPSGAEEGEAACRGRRGGGSASPTNQEAQSLSNSCSGSEARRAATHRNPSRNNGEPGGEVRRVPGAGKRRGGLGGDRRPARHRRGDRPQHRAGV